MLLLTPNQQCQSTEGNKIQQDTIPIICGISPGGGTERDTVGRVCGKRIVLNWWTTAVQVRTGPPITAACAFHEMNPRQTGKHMDL